MSLFVVRAQHSSETCPAGDPQMGAMLLQHLSQDNAGKSGINIQASAGVEGQHTLNVILEASDIQKVQEFMAPFADGVCRRDARHHLRSHRRPRQVLAGTRSLGS